MDDHLCKYYAVRKGRKTGIYTSWKECEAQVKGHPGASYKSFRLLSDAEDFMCIEEDTSLPPSPGTAVLMSGEAIAYVDGSFDVRYDTYGSGVVIFIGDDKLTFSDYGNDPDLSKMHNVAGELLAAIKAMRVAIEHGVKKLTIYHDYAGIAKWCTGEWKPNRPGTIAYKSFCQDISQDLQLSFVKVAAHSGDRYNDEADQLAKQAIRELIEKDDIRAC